MGHTRHHAIVVCSCGKDIREAHRKAKEIFSWVSPVSPEATNGCRAFFIPPDGSNEGWDTSIEGDNRRSFFIDWMKSRGEHWRDDVLWLKWVEVQFGDDYGISLVTGHSDDVEGR